jgi:ribosomal-protein-alanine N-acetyltransferase
MTRPLPCDAFPRRIETGRLYLRPPEEGEAALYARHAQEAYATQPEPISDDEARAFAAFMLGHWERYGFGFFVIDIADGFGKRISIGHAGFKYVDAWPNHWPQSYNAIELGYSVVPSARGRGYVTEAARAVLTAAFAALDVPSIRAKCRHDNPKSAAVLLRCGMTELEATEGTRRFEIARPATVQIAGPFKDSGDRDEDFGF